MNCSKKNPVKIKHSDQGDKHPSLHTPSWLISKSMRTCKGLFQKIFQFMSLSGRKSYVIYMVFLISLLHFQQSLILKASCFPLTPGDSNFINKREGAHTQGYKECKHEYSSVGLNSDSNPADNAILRTGTGWHLDRFLEVRGFLNYESKYYPTLEIVPDKTIPRFEFYQNGTLVEKFALHNMTNRNIHKSLQHRGIFYLKDGESMSDYYD